MKWHCVVFEKDTFKKHLQFIPTHLGMERKDDFKRGIR